MNDYGVFASTKYEAMVDSRFVAEVFEKQHKHVLRDIAKVTEPKSGLSEKFVKENFISDKYVMQAIKGILESSEEFRRLNFKPSNYVNEQNHKQPCYVMTRDGFT